MKDKHNKSWNLIPHKTAEFYLICCINEAVHTFAKDNNIEIPNMGGFALPYSEPFNSIVKDYIPRQWAIEYIHWAIDETLSTFAKEHNLEYKCEDSFFLKQFSDDLDRVTKAWQERRWGIKHEN